MVIYLTTLYGLGDDIRKSADNQNGIPPTSSLLCHVILCSIRWKANMVKTCYNSCIEYLRNNKLQMWLLSRTLALYKTTLGCSMKFRHFHTFAYWSINCAAYDVVHNHSLVNLGTPLTAIVKVCLRESPIALVNISYCMRQESLPTEGHLYFKEFMSTLTHKFYFTLITSPSDVLLNILCNGWHVMTKTIRPTLVWFR